MEFEKSLYEGNYNKNETLTLETIILEKGYIDNTTFELRGGIFTLFYCKFNVYSNIYIITVNNEYFNVVSDKKQIEINLIEPLPINVVDSNTYLTLSLEATSPNLKKATTNIIISLPNTGDFIFKIL